MVRLSGPSRERERVGGNRVVVAGGGRAAIGGQQFRIGGGGAHIDGGRRGGVYRLPGGQNKWVCWGRIGVTSTRGLRGTIGGKVRGNWCLRDGLESTVTDVRFGWSIARPLITGLGRVIG